MLTLMNWSGSGVTADPPREGTTTLRTKGGGKGGNKQKAEEGDPEDHCIVGSGFTGQATADEAEFNRIKSRLAMMGIRIKSRERDIRVSQLTTTSRINKPANIPLMLGGQLMTIELLVPPGPSMKGPHWAEWVHSSLSIREVTISELLFKNYPNRRTIKTNLFKNIKKTKKIRNWWGGK